MTEIIEKFNELMSLPGETEVVEWKEAKNGFDFRKIGKYFSALSNEANLKNKKSAWLIFGIKNNKDIVGTKFRKNRVDLDSLKSEVAQKTTTNISKTRLKCVKLCRTVIFNDLNRIYLP